MQNKCCKISKKLIINVKFNSLIQVAFFVNTQPKLKQIIPDLQAKVQIIIHWNKEIRKNFFLQ